MYLIFERSVTFIQNVKPSKNLVKLSKMSSLDYSRILSLLMGTILPNLPFWSFSLLEVQYYS